MPARTDLLIRQLDRRTRAQPIGDSEQFLPALGLPDSTSRALMEAIAIALSEQDGGRRRLPWRNWGRLPPLRDLLVTSSLRSGIGTDDQWLAARLYGTGTFAG